MRGIIQNQNNKIVYINGIVAFLMFKLISTQLSFVTEMLDCVSWWRFDFLSGLTKSQNIMCTWQQAIYNKKIKISKQQCPQCTQYYIIVHASCARGVNVGSGSVVQLFCLLPTAGWVDFNVVVHAFSVHYYVFFNLCQQILSIFQCFEERHLLSRCILSLSQKPYTSLVLVTTKVHRNMDIMQSLSQDPYIFTLEVEFLHTHIHII